MDFVSAYLFTVLTLFDVLAVAACCPLSLVRLSDVFRLLIIPLRMPQFSVLMQKQLPEFSAKLLHNRAHFCLTYKKGTKTIKLQVS